MKITPWLVCIGLMMGAALLPPSAEAAALPLFDGQTLSGWEGDTGKVWRVEKGEIVAGTLASRQPKNDFLCTQRSYGNFDLKLQYKRGSNNGGVQFRTQRIPNSHEVSGYQADFAPGIDGFLYDESRRKKFLARPDPETIKKLNLAEWNRYHIRAEGPRIRLWINDVLTVDYVEEDASLPEEGVIALQIHGGATEIRYREVVLEELPASPAPRKVLQMHPKDVVALVGGANLERTRREPFLQMRLLSAGLERPQRIRNLAWEGDTVFEQWRDVNFPSILQQLEQVEATVVLVQFGQMEALRGEAGLGDFVKAYEKWLDSIQKEGRRIVLLSPTPFERPTRTTERDLSVENPVLERLTREIESLAQRRGLAFVDLFHPFASFGGGRLRLTENGLHWSAAGQERVAAEVARQLGVGGKGPQAPGLLREAVLELERLWFDYGRPMNWAFLGGDRTSVAFSHDWKDTSKRLFPEEMKAFEGILQEAEENVARALAGKALEPLRERSGVPVEPPSVKAQTPEEELATLQVHPDYEVNLFASERDGIGKVVQIRWDARGRLWALCIPDYPQVKPGAKPGSKLVICEDTDRDGRADKTTVFADGLEMPLGFELGDGGVYLAASSDLWFLRDTTGGDHANERRLVLGGFGTGDTHQTINSLSWGFGGELWFSQGHSIYSRVETPYGIERHDRAGLWRFRPRTGRLDTFFNRSSAGANNWGVLTDDFGQVFHKEGAGNGGFYSVPGLSRGNLSIPSGNLQLFRSRDVKTLGFDLVGTRHFPEELQGAVVIGGVYNNTLQIHQLERDGEKFSTRQLPNLISTTNRAFRPCDVRFGPDGAIYFADWYNVIVGHYQASYRHPDRDLVHGRIWRVKRKDRALVEAPKLAGASVPELLNHLGSSERWVRYQAKRLLMEQRSELVVPAMDAWVASFKRGDAGDDTLRLQALGLYESHETPRPALLRGLLRAKDPRIRAYATRALSNWARIGAIPDALQWLEPQVSDEDWMVRLEAVVAASYLEEPAAAVVATKALDGGASAYLDHALAKTLSALQPVWEPALSEGKIQFEKDAHLLWVLKNRRPACALKLLYERVERGGVRAADLPQWLATMVSLGGAREIQYAFERAGRDLVVLDAMVEAGGGKAGPVGAEVAGALREMLRGESLEVRERAVRLAGLWKVHGLEEVVQKIGRDESETFPIRRAAFMAAADFGGKGNLEMLSVLGEESRDPKVQQAAAEALLVVSPADAVVLALKRLERVESSELAKPVLAGVLSRAEGLSAFRKALAGSQVLSPGKSLQTLRALNELGRADRGLSRALMKHGGFSAEVPEYTGEYIKEVVAKAMKEGVAGEGRKVFEQSGCVACHVVGGVGGKMGPDLSAISRGLPIDMIVTEVVWPALNVKEGYEAATVTLKNGSVVSGFRQTENDTTVSIRDLNTGEIRVIRRSDVLRVQFGGTVMPDGLTAAMSPQQLAHLIRYLSELGR
ncbi:MAG: hypothetical protein RLZZ399_1792 [Verrucomicrobiota bacterium]|jgi:putative heme-binding domain-containing protein